MTKNEDAGLGRVRVKIPFIVLGLLLFFSLMVFPVAATKNLEIKPQNIAIATGQKIPFEETLLSFNISFENTTPVNKTNSTPISVSWFLPFTNNETRTVLITNNQNTTLSNLSIITLDFVTSDNQYVISPEMITAKNTTEVVIGPDGFAAIPITFILTRAHSGQYKGALQITTNSTTDLLPVDIQIKDAWELPLIVLAIVTYFSVIVSRYISSGKMKDQLKVRIGRIRQRFLEDDVLNSATREKEFLQLIRDPIKNAIDDAFLCLSLNDLEGSRKRYRKASRLWKEWVDSGLRSEWELCLEKTDLVLAETDNYERDKIQLMDLWINAIKEIQKSSEKKETTLDSGKKNIRIFADKENVLIFTDDKEVEIHTGTDTQRTAPNGKEIQVFPGEKKVQIFSAEKKAQSPEDKVASEPSQKKNVESPNRFVIQLHKEINEILNKTQYSLFKKETMNQEEGNPPRSDNGQSIMAVNLLEKFLDKARKFLSLLWNYFLHFGTICFRKISHFLSYFFKNICHFWSFLFGIVVVLIWVLLVYYYAPPTQVPVLYAALVIEAVVAVLLFVFCAHWGLRRDISCYFSTLWPRFWLTLYSGVTGVFLPSVLLIGLGFTELYTSKPTFGANGAADYIALVFWALGTGPTAEKITELVQSFKGIAGIAKDLEGMNLADPEDTS